MLHKMLYVAVSIIFVQSVLAQNENFQIRTSGEDQNRAVEIQFSLRQAVNNALLIELPASITAEPFLISLNGSELWLKKESSRPEKTDHVHWMNTNEGLMLLFAENALTQGTVVLVKTNRKSASVQDSAAQFVLRNASVNSDGGAVPESILETAVLSNVQVVE